MQHILILIIINYMKIIQIQTNTDHDNNYNSTAHFHS